MGMEKLNAALYLEDRKWISLYADRKTHYVVQAGSELMTVQSLLTPPLGKGLLPVVGVSCMYFS